MDHVKLSFLVGTAAHISSALLNKNTKSTYLFIFGVCVCVLCFYYMELYMTSITATHWMHFNLLKGIHKKTTLPIPFNTQVTTSWPDDQMKRCFLFLSLQKHCRGDV